MGKHSLQRESRLPNSVKGALVMGAVAATGAMPAVPAMAATVNIPGLGDFDVPVPQEFEQPVQQLNQQLQQALAAPQGGVQQAPLAAPQFPSFQIPAPFQQTTPGDIALDAAKTKVGAMYSWGAAGPSTFDCSGLVKWAYRQAGIELPRTSFEQSHVGAPVAFEDLRPGDIVVTNGGGHVGLYAGDGKLLNAVQSGQPVSYTPLRPDMVVTARRIAD
ncbi:Cell wall-associated hydrolase, NlpC family [Nocardia farcinica]|uniref:Probable endopeptidase cgR_2070 n=3 Tax=Nocardiaceae TaxID=85025 RepID=A0A0H5P0V7_NOCFR|nr:putative endopeptidase [Nocardia farcinica]SLH27220.1 cell wall-associated hydrolase [Mycobacteroides abscessus subsp. abscessus]BAD60447.1 putative hydrolase [Nocardia farcinica IFM 10152]PFX08954.1 putative endopeptidase [Nocardia farcinica]CRY81158.1 Probable endopeptidase cgR_2070 precursor [Nocardia farcinica]